MGARLVFLFGNLIANFLSIAQLMTLSSNTNATKLSSRTFQTPSGYCAPYSGVICRRYLPFNVLVFYNFTTDDDGTPIHLNEQITQGLWNELISSLQDPCRNAAETLLCNYAFPQCEYAEGGYPISKPLCKEDCVAVRDLFCVREWAMLEDNKVR